MKQKKIFRYIFYPLLALNIFFLSAIVAFQITLSGEMVAVPDLSSTTIDEAKELLTKKKLFLIQSGIKLHENLERGKIISQIPAPDTKVRLNGQVAVILSAGKEKVIVPRLIGRSLQLINQTLQESGLIKGKVSHVHTSKYSAGRIIAQYPQEGEEVAKGSNISFLVSQGEKEKKYLMPDLIGMNAEATKALLIDMGFQIEGQRFIYYRGYEPGIIVNQTPRPGARIQKRNRITLEVTK